LKQVSYHYKDISTAVQSILPYCKVGKNILFYGDLGAGKTTLISNICAALGVDKNIVSSPTYSIIQEYSTPNITIAHMDWYRLKSEEDLFDVGIMEYINNDNILCFIEWPSLFEEIVNGFKHIKINIQVEDAFIRNILIQD
jgi:tRNA threonylcarbamoyladenosine biosynthesis protein TsaE